MLPNINVIEVRAISIKCSYLILSGADGGPALDPMQRPQLAGHNQADTHEKPAASTKGAPPPRPKSMPPPRPTSRPGAGPSVSARVTTAERTERNPSMSLVDRGPQSSPPSGIVTSPGGPQSTPGGPNSSPGTNDSLDGSSSIGLSRSSSITSSVSVISTSSGSTGPPPPARPDTVPKRPPPPPGRPKPSGPKPVARPRSMYVGSASNMEAAESAQPKLIVGKKPLGIPVFPLPNKPMIPTPAHRHNTHNTSSEQSDSAPKPQPSPRDTRRALPSPMRPHRPPLSASCSSIPQATAQEGASQGLITAQGGASQGDIASDSTTSYNSTTQEPQSQKNTHESQSQKQMYGVRVLPMVPKAGSVSMGDIHSHIKDTTESFTKDTSQGLTKDTDSQQTERDSGAAQQAGGSEAALQGSVVSAAAPVPRKRPTVIRAKPITTPPADLDLAIPTEKSQPQRPRALHNRLSGSAFALHIENDNHALVPKELRSSRPELTSKPGKPPKPSIKPKPALPSKPKPLIGSKPKKEKTTWYTAPPEEDSPLIDFSTPKKQESHSFKPTIIRSSSKPILNSETTLELPPENCETCSEEGVPSATQEVPGATPFDSPRKDDSPVQVKRPTIIKPNKAKTKPSQNGLSMRGSKSVSNISAAINSEQSVSNISAAINSASNTADHRSLESSKQTILHLANNSAQNTAANNSALNNVPLKRQPPPVLTKPSVRPKSMIGCVGSEVDQNLANEQHAEKTLAKAQYKSDVPLNNNTEKSGKYNMFEDSFYEDSTHPHSVKHDKSLASSETCDKNDSFYDSSGDGSSSDILAKQTDKLQPSSGIEIEKSQPSSGLKVDNSQPSGGQQADNSQPPGGHVSGPIGFEGLMSQDNTSHIPSQQSQQVQENHFHGKVPSAPEISPQTQEPSTEHTDNVHRNRQDSTQSSDSIGAEISATPAAEKSPKPSRPTPISVHVEEDSPPVLDGSRERSGSSPRAPSPISRGSSPSTRGPSPAPR